MTLWSLDRDIQPAPNLIKEFNAQNNGIKIEYRQIQFDDVVTEAMRAYCHRPGARHHRRRQSRACAVLVARRLPRPHRHDRQIVCRSSRRTIFPGRCLDRCGTARITAFRRRPTRSRSTTTRTCSRRRGSIPNKPPQTWDELVEAARKLNDPAANVYGLAFSAKANEEGTFQFLPWAQMGGGSYDNINAEGAVKALEIWKTIIDEKLASPDTLTRGQWDSTGTFNSGNAAMAISGPWELDRMVQEAKFDWGVTLLPVPQSRRRTFVGHGRLQLGDLRHHASIPRRRSRRWSTSSRRTTSCSRILANLPARSDISIPKTGQPLKDAALKVFQEQLKYAKPRGPHPEWPKISKAIQDAIQAALTGQMSPKDALDQAAEKIKGVLG